MSETDVPRASYDVVIVGAGIAGLYMLYRLRQLGLSVVVYETAEDVGGTWYWNRYPGARCDVESMDYAYSFSPELQQEWVWTEKFPSQPEILSYLDHVADRFALRRHIRFGTQVAAAHYHESENLWRIHTDPGDPVTARFVVMATGCLSTAKDPEIPGVEEFRGRCLHTAHWPQESVDLTGHRVGVIGTGSSGIQTIPVLADQVAHLTVFQRTPNYSLPAHNKPLDPAAQRTRKADYQAYRQRARTSGYGVPLPAATRAALEVEPEVRARIYETTFEAGSLVAMLQSFTDLLSDVEANETAAEFIRSKIRKAVRDPEIAEILCPTDHPFGTKRPCLDTNYYQTYNRDNVTLVNLRKTPIQQFTQAGIRTTDADYELDDVIFATGFDALTGALAAIDIRGRNGLALRDKWAQGPRAYLGLAIAGFPNMFTITGPGSPSVLSNMMVSIEQHVEWISDCVGFLYRNDLAAIEANGDAEDHWVDHVADVGAQTLHPRANSWYMGANVPGKPRVLLPYAGGVDVYREICEKVTADGYDGFRLIR